MRKTFYERVMINFAERKKFLKCLLSLIAFKWHYTYKTYKQIIVSQAEDLIVYGTHLINNILFHLENPFAPLSVTIVNTLAAAELITVHYVCLEDFGLSSEGLEMIGRGGSPQSVCLPVCLPLLLKFASNSLTFRNKSHKTHQGGLLPGDSGC